MPDGRTFFRATEYFLSSVLTPEISGVIERLQFDFRGLFARLFALHSSVDSMWITSDIEAIRLIIAY